LTKKADFNADEWSKIVEAPLLAGLHVVAAERGGSIRESVAMAKVYAEVRQHQGQSELLDELVSTPPAVDQQKVRQAGDIGPQATARLQEAVALLQQKATPEELDAYRNFVMDVAEAAAKAHKEGGFIGIGGKPVSEKEQAALNEIQAALGE
jgi:hypothetical protein